MVKNDGIRWSWLKFMYYYTLFGAGGVGLAILVIPGVVRSVFGIPEGDPITFGIAGSVYLAFALLSILGLREPLKYLPVLVLQMGYKTIWFIGIFLPFLFAGNFPKYGVSIAVVYATFLIGDLIAIPFPYVFGMREKR